MNKKISLVRYGTWMVILLAVVGLFVVFMPAAQMGKSAQPASTVEKAEAKPPAKPVGAGQSAKQSKPLEPPPSISLEDCERECKNAQPEFDVDAYIKNNVDTPICVSFSKKEHVKFKSDPQNGVLFRVEDVLAAIGPTKKPHFFQLPPHPAHHGHFANLKHALHNPPAGRCYKYQAILSQIVNPEMMMKSGGSKKMKKESFDPHIFVKP